MDNIFKELIHNKEAEVYMDDIITGEETLEKCITQTQTVTKIMEDNDIYAKVNKCKFAVQKVDYLGMILKPRQIKMDPTKLEGIAQ